MAKNIFYQNLTKSIETKNSCLCVGLDPRLEWLPRNIISAATKKHGKTLHAAADAIFEFNKIVIDQIADIVPVVKLQSAFYEKYAAAGFQALWDTASYARQQGLMVIADAKRSDISSSALAYAEAFLGYDLFDQPQTTPFDALTVNPFLGKDSLEPFFDQSSKHHKGLFVLVHTSNPGSKDLQEIVESKSGNTISELVAKQLSEMNTRNTSQDIGAVVGATFPQQAKDLRTILPKAFFLIPGLGSQGGQVGDLPSFLNDSGGGILVNASRSLVFGRYVQNSPSDTWPVSIREATNKLSHQIAAVLV